MKLSVIIVNYNTFQLTCECIESVLKFTQNMEFEIILIDNGSDECDPGFFEKKFPGIRLMKNLNNEGFGRANNKAMQMATGDAVLLLNSDVVVLDNAIAECFERFTNSTYVGCGIQLRNRDRSPQISGNYFIAGGLNQLMALPYVGRLIRWMGYRFKVKKTNVPEVRGTIDVDWINGAFLMVKKEAIEKAGMIDEDFFLYFEEIEWCARLRAAGKMCIYGDLSAIHLQGGSANDAFESQGEGYYNLYDRKGLQIMISGLVRIRKQYGRAWFIFHLLFYLATIPVFFLGVLTTSLFNLRRSYSFKQFSGYARNCMKLLSLSGTIIRNRPYFYKFL